MREGVTVTVLRPDAPRDPFIARHSAPIELTAKMLLEFRRKVQAEADALRAYAVESHLEEVRRTFLATADRLEEIIGGAAT